VAPAIDRSIKERYRWRLSACRQYLPVERRQGSLDIVGRLIGYDGNREWRSAEGGRRRGPGGAGAVNGFGGIEISRIRLQPGDRVREGPALQAQGDILRPKQRVGAAIGCAVINRDCGGFAAGDGDLAAERGRFCLDVCRG